MSIHAVRPTGDRQVDAHRGQPVITVRELRMRYGTRDVLDGVAFDIRRGELVTLLGPNGAGKTTTIEILEGFRRRSAGHVRVLGVDPAQGGEEWRARTGVVLQSWRAHARWTPRRLLRHLGAYYEPYSQLDRPRPREVGALLDMVGLVAEADQKIGTLSGGQRRRLDVAIGIVGRPELLFLDEPTAGFDPHARRDFHDLVHRLSDLEDTTILLTMLAGLLAFGVVIGPAYALAMEREDGTLLRAKAVPHGMGGYVTGQLLLHSLGLLPLLAVVLVPSVFLFEGLMHRGAVGWLTLAWVMLLGLAATLPLGIIIGSLVPSTQKVGTWGMLPILILTGISGIVTPMQQLWGWVQVTAQMFPTYWIGLGMRSAFLPDAAAALELGGSWRTGATVAVLTAWAVAGVLVAPVVLRRMARRQSGSAVQAARATAGQWVR